MFSAIDKAEVNESIRVGLGWKILWSNIPFLFDSFCCCHCPLFVFYHFFNLFNQRFGVFVQFQLFRLFYLLSLNFQNREKQAEEVSRKHIEG